MGVSDKVGAQTYPSRPFSSVENDLDSDEGVDLADLVDPSAVINGLRDLVVVVDGRLMVTWCNPSMTAMLGWSSAEVVGNPISTLVHPEDIDVALAGIGSLLHAQDMYRVGLRLLSSWGAWIPVSITGLDHTDDKRIGGVVLSIRTGEQHTRDLGDLQRQTRLDALTGLANRQSLHERLGALALLDPGHRQLQEHVTACFVGLDRFKHINDIHGHRVGDEILEITAARLRTHTASGDILARNGGDEFVVVLIGDQRVSNATDIAAEMRASLARPFEIAENVLHLTASIGIAAQRFDRLDPALLLQHGDSALNAAKQRGRDRIVSFDENLAIAARRRQQQRSMVRNALAEDRIAMHFQPIVNSELRIVGVESLVRCIGDDGPTIGPSDFLAAIDGTSLAVQLDHHAFTLSCAAARSLAEQQRGADLWVGCNIAPNTLAQGDFADRILEALDLAGANPKNICIEITETAAFEAGPSSLNALERLHDAGVQIALDDFGTGFSSLSHLLELPLSKVKIDRSFIALVHEQGPQHAITRGATTLAQSLGCVVVAEGVETMTQMMAVRDLGVDLMQGWFFAPALTLDALIDGIKHAAWAATD